MLAIIKQPKEIIISFCSLKSGDLFVMQDSNTFFIKDTTGGAISLTNGYRFQPDGNETVYPIPDGTEFIYYSNRPKSVQP